MRLRFPAFRLATLVAALVLAGCGGGDSQPQEPTRFEAALAHAPGGEPLGVGYGWVDVERLRAAPGSLGPQLDWAARALGPGAREIGRPSAAMRRIGITPLAADSLLSTATSYALALRVEGGDPRPFERAVADAGARSRAAGPWREFDLGAEWSSPLGSRLAVLGSMAARTATGGRQLVLARSALARERMLRPSGAAIEAPAVAVAAECLGDVVAARLVLNNHTHLPNAGPDLLAFGVRPPAAGPADEVFCAIDDSESSAVAAADSLEGTLAVGARDPVTGRPMDEVLARAVVESFGRSGLWIARAELEPAAGAQPGILFAAFERGSLLTYMGLQPPPSAEPPTTGGTES